MQSLKKLIFPSGGYHKHYLHFIKWSACSNVVVSVQSAIATHEMMNCITLNPEIASINYIGKDVIGQLGGLLYMTKYTNKIDSNTSKFLNVSHLVQQISFATLTLCSSAPSEYFIFIAGFSNLLTNISFTGYGAVNAKCISNISDGKNIGEIYTKITTLNTLGSTMGLSIGMFINYNVDIHSAYLILFTSVFRIYSFNRATKPII